MFNEESSTARAPQPALAPNVDAESLPELLDELAAALRDLITPSEHDPSHWERRRPGGWSTGQHVEHIALCLELGANALERAMREMLRGELPLRPWRDPIERAVMSIFKRRFLGGGQAPAATIPSERPDRARTIGLLARGLRRHRAIAARLRNPQRACLWIWNPFLPQLRWHYRFPEEVRIQTTHARHHARTIAAM